MHLEIRRAVFSRLRSIYSSLVVLVDPVQERIRQCLAGIQIEAHFVEEKKKRSFIEFVDTKFGGLIYKLDRHVQTFWHLYLGIFDRIGPPLSWSINRVVDSFYVGKHRDRYFQIRPSMKHEPGSLYVVAFPLDFHVSPFYKLS